MNTISKLLEDNYVYPEVGVEMGRRIQSQLEGGEYDNITRSVSFASRLMTDLREICHDGQML